MLIVEWVGVLTNNHNTFRIDLSLVIGLGVSLISLGHSYVIPSQRLCSTVFLDLVVGRSIEKSQTWIGEKAEQLKGHEAEAEQCGISDK